MTSTGYHPKNRRPSSFWHFTPVNRWSRDLGLWPHLACQDDEGNMEITGLWGRGWGNSDVKPAGQENYKSMGLYSSGYQNVDNSASTLQVAENGHCWNTHQVSHPKVGVSPWNCPEAVCPAVVAHRIWSHSPQQSLQGMKERHRRKTSTRRKTVKKILKPGVRKIKFCDFIIRGPCLGWPKCNSSPGCFIIFTLDRSSWTDCNKVFFYQMQCVLFPTASFSSQWFSKALQSMCSCPKILLPKRR